MHHEPQKTTGRLAAFACLHCDLSACVGGFSYCVKGQGQRASWSCGMTLLQFPAEGGVRKENI